MQMSSNTSTSRPAAVAQANGIISNWDLVEQGFKELRPILRCYVVTTLKAAYGEDKWWNKAVRHSLTKEQQKSLEGISNLEEREKAMDVSVLLRIITKRWDKNFRRRLVGVSPKLLEDLSRAFEDCERETRRGGGHCSSEDADRWLHEMQKLCKNTSVMSDGLSSANTANRIECYRKAVHKHGDARREALQAEQPQPVRVVEPHEQRAPEAASTAEEEPRSQEAPVKHAQAASVSAPAAQPVAPAPEPASAAPAAVEPQPLEEPASPSAAPTSAEPAPTAVDLVELALEDRQFKRYELVPLESTKCYTDEAFIKEVLYAEAPSIGDSYPSV